MGNTQTELGSNEPDADGRWIIMPTARKAAAHATPFPDFGPDCEVGMAVHDINIGQMVRIAERETAR
jgi:hypothetical protein